jgi:hypothetical protein
MRNFFIYAIFGILVIIAIVFLFQWYKTGGRIQEHLAWPTTHLSIPSKPIPAIQHKPTQHKSTHPLSISTARDGAAAPTTMTNKPVYYYYYSTSLNNEKTVKNLPTKNHTATIAAAFNTKTTAPVNTTTAAQASSANNTLSAPAAPNNIKTLSSANNTLSAPAAPNNIKTSSSANNTLSAPAAPNNIKTLSLANNTLSAPAAPNNIKTSSSANNTLSAPAAPSNTKSLVSDASKNNTEMSTINSPNNATANTPASEDVLKYVLFTVDYDPHINAGETESLVLTMSPRSALAHLNEVINNNKLQKNQINDIEKIQNKYKYVSAALTVKNQCLTIQKKMPEEDKVYLPGMNESAADEVWQWDITAPETPSTTVCTLSLFIRFCLNQNDCIPTIHPDKKFAIFIDITLAHRLYAWFMGLGNLAHYGTAIVVAIAGVFFWLKKRMFSTLFTGIKKQSSSQDTDRR